MGSYNCKDCLEKDINVMNELLINTNSINNESDQENIRNTRSSRLKVLKSNKPENEIINIEKISTGIETNNIIPVKNMKKNQKILRKEERDNNILLKTELNKINDINIDMNNLNQKNQLNNSEEIKRIIELQRKQIIAQEKIIEEYKNKQKKQLEQTQQNLLTKSQNIEKKKTYMIIHNNQLNNKNIFPKIKQSQTAMRNNIQKLSISKSSPKLNIKKDLQKNDLLYNDINPNMIPSQFAQFEKTLILKPNFINFEENIEENDNYERVDEYSEEIEYLMNSNQNNQSKKFKIETYEPIEPGNKNENNELMNNYNEIFDNDKLFLEPRDSIDNNLRKAVKYKSNNNNNEKYKKNNKIDLGLKDSGQNGVNINFRGTFENKEIFNIKQIGPRDSRRKEKFGFNNDNDNNDIPYIISNDNIIKQIDNNNEVLKQQQDIFDNNNIYFSSEYNINNEQESPKFNSRFKEDINSSMQNEENLEIKTDMNNATYGPYLNQVDDINVAMSAEPVIFHKDNQIQDLNNFEMDNPLLYSDDKININYLENKNEFFQE